MTVKDLIKKGKDKKQKDEQARRVLSQDLVLVSEVLPGQISIIPTLIRPVFPGLTQPFPFSGEKFIESIRASFEGNNRYFGVVLVKKENKEDFFQSELYPVGTVMKIYRIIDVEEGFIQVIAQGVQRFTYVRTAKKEPFLTWQVEYHHEHEEKPSDELKAYTLYIISSLKDLLKLNPIFQEQLKIIVSQISQDKPGLLMDLVASVLMADPEKLQAVLETFDLNERAEKLLILLREEIHLSQLQEDIQKQIEEKVSKQQKEFFLREQLKVIKKELGLEKDEKASEIEKIENRVKNRKLTKEVSTVIREEIDKLKVLETSSPEFHVTRAYLNILTELPWGIYSKDRLDIGKARKILDEDHYGLEDVKKMILEFISTIIKKGKLTGIIICLVGPPGVGKTSIGKSIAAALNRKFFRFSVGGMVDEAEIKGHRRTYIGAMPGKIIQSLKRTGTSNPVIMLDEIDKIGTSFRGDPASALLEVLDPEQNKDFLDHYLDVRYDLSKILFITTANQLDTIPRPLLDRMDVIKLPGYILDEKVEIAKKYLIPRQLKEHGLKRSEISISDKALHYLIDHYTREAGVRNLENQIKKIMRQVTLKQAEGERGKFSITAKNIESFLGKPVFIAEELYEKSIPGVTLGLAWTPFGGATLYVEASGVKRKPSGFKQTGQLGNIMQESSEIAYSLVRSLLSGDKDRAAYFDNHFIHLHVPAGATPKDGPSAGITMALALYSLAIGKAVRKGLAMTGELTLTGKVLPIGGVREKTIAARRVGVFELIFPKENQKDFEELPDYIRKGITPHFVDYFDDVLKIAYKK
jgi:ATP-dependent Lon protease